MVRVVCDKLMMVMMARLVNRGDGKTQRELLLEIKTISPIVSHKLIGRSGDYQIYLPDNDTLVNGMVECGDGGGDDICFALLL